VRVLTDATVAEANHPLSMDSTLQGLKTVVNMKAHPIQPLETLDD
jgi:hypothetical protein